MMLGWGSCYECSVDMTRLLSDLLVVMLYLVPEYQARTVNCTGPRGSTCNIMHWIACPSRICYD